MSLKLALIGCGGMGLRHTLGYIELRKYFDSFDLVAVCDINESPANHIADEVENATGKRPRVFTDVSKMFDEAKPDAVDIVTDTRMHHSFAIQAFEAGASVITEKPMGLTLKACRMMKESAERNGKKLSIGEQYRRDPMNRLTKALIDAGAIGQPYFGVKFALGGGSGLMHDTGWRALKSRAGSIILEQGVHESDLLLYFLGPVESVFAQTALFTKTRERQPVNATLAKFYQHRVEQDFADQKTVEIDQEDTAFGVIRFESGAIGQFTLTNASHGHSVGVSTVHGSKGTVLLPPSRSGQGPKVMLEGRSDPLSGEELLALVPEWELDEITSTLWDGETRMASYDYPFELTDRKLVAVELQELAVAIETGAKLEVDADVGMQGLALPYGVLESGISGLPVLIKDVIDGTVETYQDEINIEVGI